MANINVSVIEARNGTIHVRPGDGHKLDGRCWCNPQVEFQKGWSHPIVVHFAVSVSAGPNPTEDGPAGVHHSGEAGLAEGAG